VIGASYRRRVDRGDTPHVDPVRSTTPSGDGPLFDRPEGGRQIREDAGAGELEELVAGGWSARRGTTCAARRR
jgi:hypothetical protein